MPKHAFIDAKIIYGRGNAVRSQYAAIRIDQGDGVIRNALEIFDALAPVADHGQFRVRQRLSRKEGGQKKADYKVFHQAVSFTLSI
jgi:hypothetical protein